MDISTKYSVGDALYCVNRVHKVSCWVCKGRGIVEFDHNFNDVNTPEFRYLNAMKMLHPDQDVVMKVKRECPNCKGKGKIVSDCPFFEIRGCVVVEVMTEQTINSSTTYYKIEMGDKVSKVTENELFKNIDDVTKVCNYLNFARMNVPEDTIKISSVFAKTFPSLEKLNMRIMELKNYGKCDVEILINKDGLLIDGYTSYLAYRMFGWKHMPVVIVPDDFIPQIKTMQKHSKPYMNVINSFSFPTMGKDVKEANDGN